MRDLYNNLSVLNVEKPVSATGTQTSDEIDLQGFDSNIILVNFGFSLDTLNGTNYWGIVVQESDTSGGTFTDVANADLVTSHGAGNTYPVNASDRDETVYKYEYKGSKRFIRIRIVENGTLNTGTPVAVTAILGNPNYAPVA